MIMGILHLGSTKKKLAPYVATNLQTIALGLWNGSRSIPVIKQMLGKSRMIVRMTPYNENPFTATFDITGLENEIAPLRDACQW
ncbi:type VI secretion system-associated protein TagO [Mesorhizobium xinjiangense]|uniref:type VI secretion system-associated protein TagO n=1 Tax=Mesorhizobium xinjiangense TaxID=2678685 RepID=UPI0012EE1860